MTTHRPRLVRVAKRGMADAIAGSPSWLPIDTAGKLRRRFLTSMAALTAGSLLFAAGLCLIILGLLEERQVPTMGGALLAAAACAWIAHTRFQPVVSPRLPTFGPFNRVLLNIGLASERVSTRGAPLFLHFTLAGFLVFAGILMLFISIEASHAVLNPTPPLRSLLTTAPGALISLAGICAGIVPYLRIHRSS